MRNLSPRKTRDTELGLSGWGRGVGNSLTRLFSFPITAVSRSFGIKPGNPGVPRVRVEPWPGNFLAGSVSGLEEKYTSAPEE